MRKQIVAALGLTMLLSAGSWAQTMEGPTVRMDMANRITMTTLSAANLVTFVPGLVLDGIDQLANSVDETPAAG